MSDDWDIEGLTFVWAYYTADFPGYHERLENGDCEE